MSLQLAVFVDEDTCLTERLRPLYRAMRHGRVVCIGLAWPAAVYASTDKQDGNAVVSAYFMRRNTPTTGICGRGIFMIFNTR